MFVDILESLKKDENRNKFIFVPLHYESKHFYIVAREVVVDSTVSIYTINGNILNKVQVGQRKVLLHECMKRSPAKYLSHRSITSSFPL